MSGLAQNASRRPWHVLLLFLALTLVGFGLSGVVSGRLNDSLSQYDDPSTASSQDWRAARLWRTASSKDWQPPSSA